MKPDDYDGVLICGRAGKHYPFTDNVTANCQMCGVEVVHRPKGYEGKNLAKVCMDCGLILAVSQKEEPEIVTTEYNKAEFDEMYGEGTSEATMAMAKKEIMELRKQNPPKPH